jgi:hypothetical protein
MGVSGQLYAPSGFTHEEGGSVYPRAGLDDVEYEKVCFPCRESNSGRSARSSSLYGLCYLDSILKDKFLFLNARPFPLPQKSSHEPLSEFPKRC